MCDWYVFLLCCIFIPPANKVLGGGHIGITLSVCLSVRLFTSCPELLLTPCPIWIIFHTIIVHDPRMCHDLNPRSFRQGHSALIPKFRVRAISPHCHVGSGYFTQLLSITQGCVITLTQGHTSKVKVTVHTYPNSVSGPLLLTAMLDLDNISHICCP